MHYLILGSLFNDDAVLSEEGEVITPATPMAGYHLNTSAKLEGLDSYLSTPTTPKVKLNTEKQYFYTFADEVEFNSLCLVDDEFNTTLFVPNVPVPNSVQARQAHAILIIRGLRQDIIDSFDLLDEPERRLALNDFNNSNEFERHNSRLVTQALNMGMTNDDIDNLFIEAAKL